MNDSNDQVEGSQVSDVEAVQTSISAGPYSDSVAGRKSKLLLLALAVPLLIWFAYGFSKPGYGLMPLVGCLLLIGSLVFQRGPQVLRIVLIVIMTVNVGSLAINPIEIPMGSKVKAPSIIPLYLLAGALLVASIFEIVSWVKVSTRETITKTIGWGILAVPAAIYIVALPVVNSIWVAVAADEKTLALQDPNWNIWNEMSFRVAKFAVFGAFTYLGACLGSFLNVVAYCVPRGEGVGIRDSKCPECKTKISRLDNLPIFSYINLGARCRSCRVPIPARYLVVELLVGAIFGSLFLYQLVTGCPNIPNMYYGHAGILWMILYPKWPAIGLYFFHAFLMCILVVLSLMEWDRLEFNKRFASLIGAAAFLSAAVYLPLLPVSVFDHLPFITADLPSWLEQLIQLIVGGVTGAAIGRIVASISKANPPGYITFGFLLVGIVLGWQALLQVTLVFGLVFMLAQVIPVMKFMRQLGPTSMLFAATFLHHPFWKMLAGLWSLG